MTILRQGTSDLYLVVDGGIDDPTTPARLFDAARGKFAGPLPLGSWLNHLGGNEGPWGEIARRDVPSALRDQLMTEGSHGD